MTDLVVVVPSRGRPNAARELADAFEKTCSADTELVFAVDGDDPTRTDYIRQAPTVFVSPSVNMVQALNCVAKVHASGRRQAFAIGFMGDDHRPRTPGWDAAYLDALRELGTGIVYGDDLLQHRALPTQCAMTADIVRALGHMAPPTFTHLYIDDYWLRLGTDADCIRYLPDVVVEHRHPVAGKAQWDEGYLRVNNPEMYEKDRAAWGQYLTCGFIGDVEKVRALRADAPRLHSGGLVSPGAEVHFTRCHSGRPAEVT